MNPESTSSKPRCEQCKKKLGVMEYRCKCEKRFCISHLQPQEHNCTFDYKVEAQTALTKQLDSGPRASSFEKI